MFGRVMGQGIGEKRLVESLVYLAVEVLFGINALDGTINQVLVFAPKIKFIAEGQCDGSIAVVNHEYGCQA